MGRAVETAQQVRRVFLRERLWVNLIHAPQGLAAAWVRVNAGSHDEPSEHPGLAHFLEHLLFLDSATYCGEQRLMPWLQARGGLVNASTRARTTDYFFESRPNDLGEGLSRLLDMLARPRLEPGAQLSEREVLDAEYQARAGDATTLIDAALASALPGHPLQRFVAGRRASLVLESAQFQQALDEFHDACYQPGNCELWLLGPQSLHELQALAEEAMPPWSMPVSKAPADVPPLPPFTRQDLALCLPGLPRLVLAFALEEVDAAAEQALVLLGELLADESPGSLLAQLIQGGLADGAALRLAYRAADQALLVLTFELLDEAAAAPVAALFLDWVQVLRAQAGDALHKRWQAAHWQSRPPLEQLHDRVRGLPAAPDTACLAQLQAARMIRLQVSAQAQGQACEVAGFVLQLGPAHWPSVALASQPWHFFAPSLASTAVSGTLHLRWRFAQPLRRCDYLALCQALRPFMAQAQLQGVELRLEAEGGDLLLCLRGPVDRLESSLRESLAALKDTAANGLAQGARLLQRERQRQAGELPIRQLLAALPGVLAGEGSGEPDWSTAQWDWLGLRCALPATVQPPGSATVMALQPAPLPAGTHWWRQPGQGDAALLLFYPLVRCDAHTEACWRLLARVLEPAFQQRLRGELQLAYALYCGFRQVAGWRGILFAVQSPWAQPDELLAHIQAFLHAQPLAETDSAGLADSLLAPADDDSAWLDHLAGVAAGHRSALFEAARCIGPADLEAARGELLAARGGCWLLTNRD